MEELQKVRLLFIDSREEWLNFALATLADLYDVVVIRGFEALFETQEDDWRCGALAFIGLNVARENIEALGHLACSYQWQFVVLCPGIPDGRIARALFKAGARDVQSKPYEPESIKRIVEEEIRHVTEWSRTFREQRDRATMEMRYKRKASQDKGRTL